MQYLCAAPCYGEDGLASSKSFNISQGFCRDALGGHDQSARTIRGIDANGPSAADFRYRAIDAQQRTGFACGGHGGGKLAVGHFARSVLASG